MSFIRRIKKGDKVYLAEVESRRMGGKVVQRFIRYVGKEANGRTVLSTSISDVEVEEVKLYGPLLVLHHLAQEIQLPEQLGAYSQEILSLVYAHCLDYRSLNHMPSWFERTDLNFLLNLEGLTERRLVGALDSLEAWDAEVWQQHLFEGVSRQYRLRASGVIYDGLFWKNHFSTIGIIGMNEACLNFLGKDLTTDPGQTFALRVMDFLRETLAGFQETTGTLFNLEATPGEGTSYRLAMLDKRRFAEIICANETDVRRSGAAPYYTNSSQLPVGYTADLFETLKLQDELQCKYTGGTVLHIFLGEQVKDTVVIRNLVRKIAAHHRLPYFTLTPTFSICPTHGYLDGEQTRCRHCSEATEVYSGMIDNFGETPTGEIGMLMHEPYRDDAFYFGTPSPKTHLYYSLTIILKDSQGRECTSGIGFYLKDDVISVCSGHIVFTVDLTPEIQAELDTAELLI